MPFDIGWQDRPSYFRSLGSVASGKQLIGNKGIGDFQWPGASAVLPQMDGLLVLTNAQIRGTGIDGSFVFLGFSSAIKSGRKKEAFRLVGELGHWGQAPAVFI